MPSTKLLLTGGLGYIASHTAVALAQAGYEPVLLDNCANASPDVLDGLRAILGCAPEFVRADVRDAAALRAAFAAHDFAGVLHFAGLKSVGESCEKPDQYWDNNVVGSLTLARVALEAGVRDFVFSSSATVYDASNPMPLREDARLGTTNPYGTTKLAVEKLLEDFARHAGLRAVALRYFNPVGAHPSGLIGERPNGVPANLLPFVMDVAAGKRPQVNVTGADWPTPDGTGVRDYLHVMDLAEGHVAAWESLASGKLAARPEALRGAGEGLFFACNLGTGQGTSVRQVVAMAREVTGRPVPSVDAPRRPGDLAAVWADPSLARTAFGWRARRTVREAVTDAWGFSGGFPPPAIANRPSSV